MHLMVKSHGVRQTLLQEAPFAVAAIAVAELFYKFHSFTLECVAFLATWYALSLIGHATWKRLSKSAVGEAGES